MKRTLALIILGLFLVSCQNPFDAAGTKPITIVIPIDATPVPTPPPYNLSPINASNVAQIQQLYLIQLSKERTQDLLAISPDKKWIAASRKDGAPLYLQRLKWNSDGSFTPKGDGGTTFFLYKTTSLAFSPDSMSVAIANGADNTVLIFSLIDLPNENNKIVLPIGTRPQAVAFTRDSQKLIVGTWGGSQATLQLWNIGTASLEQEISGGDLDGVCSATISPDGKTLATGSCVTLNISTWDIDNSYAPLSQLDLADACPDPCLEQRNIFGFNPSTGEIVSAVNFPNISIHDPHTGKITATVTTQPAGARPNGSNNISALAFASEGDILVMAANQEIQLIDAKSGKLLWHYTDPKHTTAVAISADSTFLVSFNVDGEMVFWGIPPR